MAEGLERPSKCQEPVKGEGAAGPGRWRGSMGWKVHGKEGAPGRQPLGWGCEVPKGIRLTRRDANAHTVNLALGSDVTFSRTSRRLSIPLI